MTAVTGPGSRGRAWTAPPADEAVDPAAPRDLLAAWSPGGFLMESGGTGVVTAGELRGIVVPGGPGQAARAAALAEAALSGLGIDGAVVTGALPFQGDAPARLVVPERVTVTSIRPRDLDLTGARGGGPEPRRPAGGDAAGASGRAPAKLSRAATAAGRAPAQRSDAGAPAGRPPGRTGRALSWHPHPPAAAYARAVAEAISRIGAGELEKVVLARSLVAPNPGLDVATLLAELRRRDPGGHLFCVPGADGGAFVGATPETLVRREGIRVLSLPVAGTAARRADPSLDRQAAEALLLSAKDRHEHAPVVEAVTDALAPHCSELSVDGEPHLIATATVWHLATAVRGRLRAPAPSALALAAALHPTPAVCGTPPGAAANLIARLEPASRGLYSGLVGWVDSRGDGEWAVSLRCALVTAGSVRIDAGAGIVAESQPDLELAETEVKFRTIMDALEASAAMPGQAGA